MQFHNVPVENWDGATRQLPKQKPQKGLNVQKDVLEKPKSEPFTNPQFLKCSMFVNYHDDMIVHTTDFSELLHRIVTFTSVLRS